jgi:hypothetical protein
LSTWFTRRFVTLLGLEQSGFTSWNLLFSQVGGVRERAPGSPTHPLAAKNGKGELCTALRSSGEGGGGGGGGGMWDAG